MQFYQREALCSLSSALSQTLCSNPDQLILEKMSRQAARRHPEDTPYRCFLSDLAGFEGFRRAGPTRTKASIPQPERLVKQNGRLASPGFSTLPLIQKTVTLLETRQMWCIGSNPMPDMAVLPLKLLYSGQAKVVKNSQRLYNPPSYIFDPGTRLESPETQALLRR